MELIDFRKKWEKGKTVLLTLSNPNRNRVFVLLKGNLLNTYHIYQYYLEENREWTVWFEPNFSNFSNLEQGLGYLDEKFKQYVPQ